MYVCVCVFIRIYTRAPLSLSVSSNGSLVFFSHVCLIVLYNHAVVCGDCSGDGEWCVVVIVSGGGGGVCVW